MRWSQKSAEAVVVGAGVAGNKGSAGVDGRTVQDTAGYLKQAWPEIRRRLLDGSYRPDPVRRVGIPKPGGGVRELGIRPSWTG